MKTAALVRWLSKGGYVHSPLVRNAFSHIDRAEFVSEEFKDDAHENLPIPIGFGRVMPQPLTVAFMLELLELKLGEKVLQSGTGSGWQTALLAYVVSGKAEAEALVGSVVAMEPVEELSELATKNLEKYHFISNGVADVRYGDPIKGVPKAAPFDKIISSIALQEIPTAWKEQLRIGGRIVAPIGESIIVLDKNGPTSFSQKQYFGFDFHKL